MKEKEYLVTGEEMQAYDTYTIAHIGIPAMVLMERAALETVSRIEEHLAEMPGCGEKTVLCVCGTGNNGGDGLCVARLLMDRGIHVEIALIGCENHLSVEAASQLAILKQYGATWGSKVPDREYAVIVDAMFGTGLTREITGVYREAVDAVNEKDAFVVSIDIPSGIHAKTGEVLGTAVKAQETVCLAFLKRGLYLYPGTLYTGTVTLADIGITEKSFQNVYPGMYTRVGGTPELKKMLPKRVKDGNKGTFGKLLLVAGSADMAGAAILSATGAYRAGAGMVKLVIPERIREIVQTRLPEALIQVYENGDGITPKEVAEFKKNMEWADAVAIGPGLSLGESGGILLNLVLEQTEKPLIIDADGLNLLAKSTCLQKHLKDRTGTGAAPVILTPHMGELARLLSRTVGEVTADEVESTMEAAEKTGCIVVGKSARTQVCQTGKPVFLNTAGNDRMATAGSGDVLTGIIGAFLVQGMEAHEAAECGVYLHACAGDTAAERAGGAGILASDLAREAAAFFEH